MHTENSILIHADPQTIFSYASATERWPEILPHYRWVKVLQQDGNWRVVEMAARRDFFPVRWVSEQFNNPDTPSIRFCHIGGITKGMEVEWRFTPESGGTRVSILHELTLHWPLIGGIAADRVIGPHFVGNIAGKTLRRIKELSEAPRIPQESS